jgi:hypothetical protein
MADALKLYISAKNGTAVENALVESADEGAVSVTPRALVLGDSPTIEVYIVDGEGAYDTRSGNASYTPRLALAVPGATPTGGTYILGYGSQTSGTVTSGKRYKITSFVSGDDFTNIGATANATGAVFTASGTTPTTWTNSSTLVEVTTDLAYNADETAIQTALNLLATVAAAGNVTVDGDWPVFIIQFNSAGSRTDIYSDGTDLLPDGQTAVSEIQAGTSTLKERQSLLIARGALAQINSFTPITDGWRGVLNCGTYPLKAHIGSEAVVSASTGGQVIEFEITDTSTGVPTTLMQVGVDVRNEGIRPGIFVPLPLDDYYTRTESLANFAQNQYAITGLTGGGAGNLDGIVTADITTALVALRLSDAIKFYRLESGTDAESSPDIIRPDDYNGASNAKVWKLCAVDATNPPWYESLAFSAAGNTDVTPPAGGGYHTAVVVPSAGAGAYTRTVSILTANALQGSRVTLRVEMPASANPTVEIRNATSGGTLLLTLSGNASAVTYPVELVYTGSAWRLASNPVQRTGANYRINGPHIELLDDADGTTWKKVRMDNGALYTTA